MDENLVDVEESVEVSNEANKRCLDSSTDSETHTSPPSKQPKSTPTYEEYQMIMDKKVELELQVSELQAQANTLGKQLFESCNTIESQRKTINTLSNEIDNIKADYNAREQLHSKQINVLKEQITVLKNKYERNPVFHQKLKSTRASVDRQSPQTSPSGSVNTRSDHTFS